MQALDYLVQNWSSRESSQIVLKFGLLLLPIAIYRFVPGWRRDAGRLVLAFAAATGLLFLVFAYLQIARGEFTAALNGWEDAEFAVEIAGYELAVAGVLGWTAWRGDGDALRGVALLAALGLGLAAMATLTGLGGRAPLLAQLGCWGLAVGVALLASAALRRTAWARPLIAVAALFLLYAGFVHLHAWLWKGDLAMGHVGPSLWHDLAFPFVATWVLRRGGGHRDEPLK